MSPPVHGREAPVGTAELRATLEEVLGRHFGAACPVRGLDRRPSPVQSSCALEELEVHLEDGTRLPLVFKDLGPQALLEGARQARPAFLYDPRREPEVYRSVLASARLGTAACYGAILDAVAGRYWLFLEKVPGLELYRAGELATWGHAARWLAGFHAHFTAEAERLAREAHLLRHDAEFYFLWMRRALAVHPGLGPLARTYGQVVERLLALPVTLIHGEFYASNVLVQDAAGRLRVCPVDWEMAAVGPGLVDVVALTAGNWTEGEKEGLALTYREALPAGPGSPEAFLEDLDYCRLHQAVQWLGWSADWVPPREHAHDWLGEALSLAEKLRL